jgi:hypothetical protein
VARYRLTLGYRVRRAWRAVRARFARAPRPQRDVEADEIRKIEALISRLEIATAIGSVTACGQLAGMADDRVGVARRRLAAEALHRLHQRAQTEVSNAYH